jgi:hypothetical protein
LVIAHWSLVIGHCSLIIGHWSGEAELQNLITIRNEVLLTDPLWLRAAPE